MNMIERVAQVITDARIKPIALDGTPVQYDPNLDEIKLAIAVIAAMREPTSAMVCAGEKAYLNGMYWGAEYCIMYRAMIDAALKE